MATPSPIYRSTAESTDRLYYRPQGSSDLVQIANPQELQNLAKQGAVEVGKPYLPYTPASASQTPPAAPGSGSQGQANPELKTEVSPGVFSSSKLSNFYDKQIELMRPQFEAAQKALDSATAGLGSMQAPDLRQSYDAQYGSKVAPLDQAIADRTSKLNALDTNIAALEDAVRAEIGGRASEASIQAEVARRAKPLILERQSFATEIGSLNDQRSAAIAAVQQGVTYEQQGFQNRTALFDKQRELAQSTLDAFSSLVEKGANASNQDVDNFRQTFSTLLTQAPDVLRNLSQDEVAQLQGGYVPYSVMRKIGDTINEQKLAQAASASPKIFGSAQSGYYTLDASGNPKQVVAPATASTGGLTQSQRIQAAVKLMEADPASYPDIDSALAAVSSLSGSQGGPALGSGRSSVNVGGFDISTYATDPNHEAAVATIVDRIGQFNSVKDMDAYIQKVAPGSPVTGAMVANASQQFQVPWEILVAMMQQDSNLGTAGKGAKTFNPGNVGNDDAGNVRNYGSWQAGVNAVGDWLAKHRASSTPDYIDTYSRQVQNIMSGAGKDARNAAIRDVSELVRQGDVQGAKRTVEALAYNQMSATDKGSYDENANAIASLSVASQLLEDPGLAVGPYKALFQSKSPYALIQQDPKYAAFKVFTDLGQAQIKRAFFGTAVSANEQETAGGFLVLPTDDIGTIKVKLGQLPKVLQFANDAKVAKAADEMYQQVNNLTR